MKKLHTLTVIDRQGIEFCFQVNVDPKYVPEWQARGIEIYPLHNVIPEWVVNIGMTKPWCFMQDIFNFKNPWGE